MSDRIFVDTEIVLPVAVKLFEIGRLSSGRAAELAGMPRVKVKGNTLEGDHRLLSFLKT